MIKKLLIITALLSPSAHGAKLAIIIDDLGNQYRSGMRAVNLTPPLNLAFLPQTPYSRTLSERSYKKGHLNMLHQPMQSLSGAQLGPGGLSLSTPQKDYKAILERNLASISHPKGINNHMGSLLTQNQKAMDALMPLIKKTGLFFIDSKTSANSVAEKTAKKYDITTAHRHVFLDHIRKTEFIDQQFTQAFNIAKKQGFAILIGHPYSKTLDYLEKQLPLLYLYDIELVRLDEYLKPVKIIPKPSDHPIFLFGLMP